MQLMRLRPPFLTVDRTPTPTALLRPIATVKEEVDKLLEGDLGDMEAIDDEDEEWEM